MSELQQVRTKIEELEKGVDDVKAQIATPDPSLPQALQQRLTVALQEQLAKLQDQLATLRKKELLHAPLPGGMTDSPPRKSIQVGNYIGYAHFTLRQNAKQIFTELLLDTGAGLELLLVAEDARKLDLKSEGADLNVFGIGGTSVAKYGGEVQVEVELVRKDSNQVEQIIKGHLRCYFFEEGCAASSPSPAETHDQLNDPMEVGADTRVRLNSAPVLPVEPVLESAIVAGSLGRSLLGRPGLLRLGLEMKLEKQYLFQAAVASAVVL